MGNNNWPEVYEYRQTKYWCCYQPHKKAFPHYFRALRILKVIGEPVQTISKTHTGKYIISCKTMLPVSLSGVCLSGCLFFHQTFVAGMFGPLLTTWEPPIYMQAGTAASPQRQEHAPCCSHLKYFIFQVSTCSSKVLAASCHFLSTANLAQVI